VKKIHVLIFVLFGLSAPMLSKHIVGGEIYYDFLGADKYRITLKVYRDCFGGGAAFDGLENPCYLTVMEGNGDLVGVYSIGAPVVKSIPPSINNQCMDPPNNICVEEGIYQYTLTLPPKTGGYYIVYQRCCRNNTIVNLSLPGTQGSTYYTKIPGPEVAVVNNSPRFKNFPPIYICSNVSLIFDHVATDPDGDQLLYSLYTPFQGLTPDCPALGGSCPGQAPPPPYQNVVYSGSYSGSYPVSALPAFSIHPLTGKLTGKPNLTGQFVVGVCVKEYRNNQLINTHFRDFQFNIINCNISVMSIFDEQPRKCMGNTFNFVNQSFGNVPMNYHWDFGIPGIDNDTSTLVHPSFTYPDTGTYMVTLIANPGGECSDTLQQYFYAYPEIKAGFEKTAPQCLKNNAFSFTNTSSHSPDAVFKWDFTENATPAVSFVKNPSGIIFSRAGKYYVKLLLKQYVCMDSLRDTLSVIDRPEAVIGNGDISLCAPAKVGFINKSSSELPYFCQWRYSDGSTDYRFEPEKLFSDPGVYSSTLMVITTGLCRDTVIASLNNIMVNPLPVAAFSLSPEMVSVFDNEIYFTDGSQGNISAREWDFGDNTVNRLTKNPVHSYQAPGTYLISEVVTTNKNCKDTAFHTVKILPEFRFWIPNTFTPNGDRLNDVFMPKSIGLLKYEFRIFDKWGQKIFETEDAAKGWDGTYQGRDCQQDVYVWKITFVNEVSMKQEEHFGHVLLLSGEK
jgi:gliding motility-associated-like protein